MVPATQKYSMSTSKYRTSVNARERLCNGTTTTDGHRRSQEYTEVHKLYVDKAYACAIPGKLDWRDLAAADPETHKPQDRRGYAVACQDMARLGLTPRDISEAVGRTPAAVRELLAERLPRVR